MAQFNENLELLNAKGITVKLTNNLAEMIAGGNGTYGIVKLYNVADDNNDAAKANILMDGSQATISIGGQTLDGNLSVINGSGKNRIVLNGSEGDIRAGGNNVDGDLYLFRSNGNNDSLTEATLHLNGQDASITMGNNGTNGDIFLKSTNGKNRVRLLGSGGNLWLGGNGQDGDIVLFRSTGDNETLDKATIHLNGGGGDLAMGGNGVNGDITLKKSDNKNTVRLKGDANFWLGGNGVDGDIVLFRTTGDNKTLSKATVHIDGQSGDMILGGNEVNGDITLKSDKKKDRVRLLGSQGNLWLGGNGADGDLVMFRANGDNKTLSKATVHIDGEIGDLSLGSNGVNGDIKLKSKTNKDRIRLLGSEGNLWLGGNGADGDIVLFKSNGDNKTLADGTIHLNGESGNIRCNDVIIPGADFAEDFDIESKTAETLEPGTVMVLGKDGKLHESNQAFDRKVVGVVSGAGKYNVGITLDRQLNSENRKPIALSGKVMCKIDANYGSIEVGDLITTSPRKGYAMKAEDPFKAFGAVIGKALADFPTGDGMLPILVALQ